MITYELTVGDNAYKIVEGIVSDSATLLVAVSFVKLHNDDLQV